ncbi:heavy metal-associated isoprenylated plant protein 47 [Arachis ipaensis]|uniref:heavy metal-associated isoprenylated plant protein 47 n=1 Tax=Arachis ipaensis TaxID=130454 RepID=UPI0007AFC517|nr:heavy metal-associated isoprenylated plant protein 47 [Arachis ipaensis]
MKQKIVIEVPLNCTKCKKKVLTICTTAEGVTAVKFIRDGKDRVEIIGEGVDAAEVTQDLRNKLKFAKLVNVSKLD